MNRRDLLKASAGIPLLRALLPGASFATPTAAPKRVVFWFQPNGCVHDKYHVKSGSTETSWDYETAGDLHTLLPLRPFKDITIHFDSSDRVATANATSGPKYNDYTKGPFGLSDYAGCVGPNPLKPLDGSGHPTRELTIGHDGPASLLTGRFPTGTVVNNGGTDSVNWAARGDSIDVALAQVMGASTRMQSLQLGVSSHSAGFNLSFRNGSPLPIMDDPGQSFSALFAGIPSTPGPGTVPPEVQKKLDRRNLVFDQAYARFSAIKSALATPDKQRLEDHFQAYRDIRSKLTTAPVVMGNCHSPTQPHFTNLNDPLQLPQRGQSMVDQMVLALACDITRVITMSWTSTATNQVFSFLPGFTAPGIADGHHPLSHAAYDGSFHVTTADNIASQEKKRRIERWYAEQLAAFLTQLKNFTEPDGSTLLDNTLVVVVNEINHSGAHNNSNMPIRLYGNLKGAIRSGRYVALPKTPLNDLWCGLANKLGVPMTTFGEPSFDFWWHNEASNWQWQHETHTVTPLAAL